MTTSWNGAICPTCGACYLGSHQCSRGDLMRRIAELYDQLDRAAAPHAPGSLRERVDPTAGCPCRVENGGSGICGCIRGSMTTC